MKLGPCSRSFMNFHFSIWNNYFSVLWWFCQKYSKISKAKIFQNFSAAFRKGGRSWVYYFGPSSIPTTLTQMTVILPIVHYEERPLWSSKKFKNLEKRKLKYKELFYRRMVPNCVSFALYVLGTLCNLPWKYLNSVEILF